MRPPGQLIGESWVHRQASRGVWGPRPGDPVASLIEVGFAVASFVLILVIGAIIVAQPCYPHKGNQGKIPTSASGANRVCLIVQIMQIRKL